MLVFTSSKLIIEINEKKSFFLLFYIRSSTLIMRMREHKMLLAKKKVLIMGYWSKKIPGAYVVNIKEFDTAAADKFSEEMIKESNGEEMLHNRYGYERNERIEKNKIGKYGEEAFKVFLREVCGQDMVVDYAQYEGSKNVDKNDVLINGLNIDVKFSRDNQNRGIEEFYNKLNFMVPQTQSVKDITVWGFCDITMKWFVILSWVDKDFYMKNYKTAMWEGVPNYKMPLRKGQKPSVLVDMLSA